MPNIVSIFIISSIIATTARSITQIKDIPDQYIQIGETRRLNLHEYFSGYYLNCSLDDEAPPFARVTPPINVNSTKLSRKFDAKAMHRSLAKITSESGDFYFLDQDSTLYNATSVSGSFTNILSLKAKDVDCYDFLQDDKQINLMIVGCHNKTSRQNFFYIVDTIRQEIIQTVTSYARPVQPFRIGLERIPQNPDVFLFFCEGSGWIELWNTTNLPNLTLTAVLDHSTLNISFLNVVDAHAVHDQIFILDLSFGVFRLSLADIPNHNFHRFSPGSTLLTRFNVDEDYHILLGCPYMIMDINWKDADNPQLIRVSDIRHTDIILQIYVTRDYYVVFGRDLQHDASVLSVLRRKEPGAGFDYPVLAVTEGRAMGYYAEESQTLTFIGSQVIGQATITDLSLEMVGGDADQGFSFSMSCQDKDEDSKTVNLYLEVLKESEISTITSSDIPSTPVLSVFNDRHIKNSLRPYYIGPAAKFTSASSNFTVERGVVNQVTLIVDGVIQNPSKSIIYTNLLHEFGRHDDIGAYFFIQNDDKRVNVSSCNQSSATADIQCITLFQTNLSGQVRSVSVGSQYLAVIDSSSLSMINIYNKTNGSLVQSITNLGECNDLLFSMIVGSERIICAQTKNNTVLVICPTQFVVLDTFSVPTPNYVYHSRYYYNRLFVQAGTQLLVYSTDLWQQIAAVPSKACKGDWQAAIFEGFIVLLSQDANAIEEYAFQDEGSNVTFMKEYPLYGMELQISNGKASYAYSRSSPILYVSAYDQSSLAFCLIYYVGEQTRNVLYQRVSFDSLLPRASFLHSYSTGKEKDTFIVINEVVFESHVVDTSGAVIYEYQGPLPDKVGTLSLPVAVSNDWQSFLRVTTQVRYWNSNDQIRLLSLQPSPDLNHTININTSSTTSQTFVIPQDLAFNGSLVSYSLNCSVQSECDSGLITLQPPAQLSGRQINLTATEILYSVATPTGNLILTRNQVHMLSRINSTILWSLEVTVPTSNDPGFSCDRVNINENGTIVIASCGNSNTWLSYLVVFSLDPTPRQIFYSWIDDYGACQDLEIVQDMVSVLTYSVWRKSLIWYYMLDYEEERLMPLFGMQYLDASNPSGSVVLKPVEGNGTNILGHVLQPDDLVIFWTNVTIKGTKVRYFWKSIDIRQVLADYDLLGHELCNLVVSATEDSSISTVILTTRDGNHLEVSIGFDGTAPFIKGVTGVYLRYLDWHVSRRISATSRFFVVYAHEPMNHANGSFLIYDRQNPNTSNIVYRNVHSIIPCSIRTEDDLKFEMRELTNESTGTRYNEFVVAKNDGRQLVYETWTHHDNLTMIIANPSSVLSTNVALTVSNHVSELQVAMNVNKMQTGRQRASRGRLWSLLKMDRNRPGRLSAD